MLICRRHCTGDQRPQRAWCRQMAARRQRQNRPHEDCRYSSRKPKLCGGYKPTNGKGQPHTKSETVICKGNLTNLEFIFRLVSAKVI